MTADKIVTKQPYNNQLPIPNSGVHIGKWILSPLEKQPEVHWLTGQFCENSKESVYRSSIKTRVKVESRLSLILGSVVFGMFAITDYHLLGLTREFYLLICMRLVVVSLCIPLAFILGRWGSYNKVWLHALPLWLLATGIILIVPLRPESLATQTTAVVLAIVAFYLLIPNLLTVAVSASLYLSIGFLAAAALFAGVSAVDTLRIALLLVMTNIVGYCALLRIERLQRKQFALLDAEREQNKHLLKEIGHRETLEAQLRMLAERDALTGLDSRSHFMKRAIALLRRSQLDKAPFSFFMIDVDHFKQINDTWGHTRGDSVLANIAAVCAGSLRPTDVIGRFGGEEFVVALPGTDSKEAQIVANRLRANVAEISLKEEAIELSLSVTIGIAIADTQEADLESLIARADQALYTGKRNGRNQVVICLAHADEH